MMNLNLGSCNLLPMFIVLVIVSVFKLKTLTISFLFFLFGGNISVIVYEYV
ncbi:Uncharacterised protein [Bacteroides thetaiotaomicron]|uniref:Uncharacterized protein n=1 Tax=Bacteroides thetaiotaomicron TaxID=818 RepID=A0A174WF89_BACT4|nr:Uncharacterised protein [Bacteroides thetaiotaomicron]